MNKMADVFLLSLLWMVCSLPIITFGAATTAFITVSMKLHKDCEGTVMKEFFSIMKNSFLRSTILWLTQLALFLLLAVDLWVCWKMKTKLGAFLLPVLAVLGLLVQMASYFTWPLLSHTREKLIGVWKLAIRLVFLFLPHALSMLVLEGLGLLVAFLRPAFAILIPFIVCYQYARVYAWVFAKDPMAESYLSPCAAYCISGAKSAENNQNLENNQNGGQK